ncbi:MAG: DUF1800 domain-containing protein [Alphaproteobacteria bacterium]|nr:DUF1800 domain-containing protein [Alphaproteobacteria bacterium]
MSLPYGQLAAIRLGFGLSPLLTSPDTAAAVAASARQSGPDAHAVTMPIVREMQVEVLRLAKLAREGGDQEEYRQYRQEMGRRHFHAVVERFVRALDAPSGFGERLVAFWASHFAVRGGNPHTDLLSAALVDEAIRPHLTGRFAEMMIAAETHPAMLLYLDQVSSVGPNSIRARRRPDKGFGLNENLAREMIELHSLGVGADYSQKDVEQLARLLAGLTYNNKSPEIFLERNSEPGAEIILGRAYGNDRDHGTLNDIHAAITDLATHEATARHIARKLAIHFISDDPPQSAINRLAGVFHDTGGDLAAVNLALAEAPELDSCFRQKVRPPFEFLVTSLRGLGVTGDALRRMHRKDVRQSLLEPLGNMGQPWARPKGPDGWPEAASDWATPQGLAMRINWAMTQPSRLVDPLPDPRRVLADALGDSASPALRWAVPKAESRRDGVALILASADFNRR